MSQVRHDIFPAYVAIISAAHNTLNEDMTASPLFPKDALQVEKARIVVYEDHVTVAVDGDNGARIIIDEDIKLGSHIKTSKNGTTNSFVTTKSGAKIVYMKDVNCGCGSRLRSWNPYTTLSA
jgi:hypothetical protein